MLWIGGLACSYSFLFFSIVFGFPKILLLHQRVKDYNTYKSLGLPLTMEQPLLFHKEPPTTKDYPKKTKRKQKPRGLLKLRINLNKITLQWFNTWTRLCFLKYIVKIVKMRGIFYFWK